METSEVAEALAVLALYAEIGALLEAEDARA
jgi:hypothetical protein